MKKRLGSRRQPDTERSIGWSLVALVVSLLGLPGLLAGEESALAIRIVEQRDTPVIGLDHPDVIDNRHGFEGGRVIKLDGVYHLFTAEMYGDPFWVKMRLAHWISGDRLQWTRRATIGESSGDYEGRDPRAATWACMPVFNDRTDRWEMFYVAYRCKPGLPGYEGRIWRASSQTRGLAGINGPWHDIGVVLQPGPEADAWESVQGVDSFFPYRVGDRWYGFFGSSNMKDWWHVGLATSDDLAGPWHRLSARNPLSVGGEEGIENPIVTQLQDGRLVAVFDTIRRPLAIGFTMSRDGMEWSPATFAVLPRSDMVWTDDVRTPLGLIQEPGGEYTILYTGHSRTRKGADDFWSVGLLVVCLDLMDTPLPSR